MFANLLQMNRSVYNHIMITGALSRLWSHEHAQVFKRLVLNGVANTRANAGRYYALSEPIDAQYLSSWPVQCMHVLNGYRCGVVQPFESLLMWDSPQCEVCNCPLLPRVGLGIRSLMWMDNPVAVVWPVLVSELGEPLMQVQNWGLV